MKLLTQHSVRPNTLATLRSQLKQVNLRSVLRNTLLLLLFIILLIRKVNLAKCLNE